MAVEGPTIKIQTSEQGGQRAFAKVVSPLNHFEFEGVLGLPPQDRRKNGTGEPNALFVVSVMPMRLNADGKRIPYRIVSPRFRARGENAERILAMKVGTYLIVRGCFQAGMSFFPLAREIEVVEDPSTRVRMDHAQLLDIALAPPRETKPRPARSKRGGRLNEAQCANVVLRYQAGESPYVTADHYLVDPSTIYRILERAGIKPQRKGGRPVGGKLKHAGRLRDIRARS